MSVRYATYVRNYLADGKERSLVEIAIALLPEVPPERAARVMRNRLDFATMPLRDAVRLGMEHLAYSTLCHLENVGTVQRVKDSPRQKSKTVWRRILTSDDDAVQWDQAMERQGIDSTKRSNGGTP